MHVPSHNGRNPWLFRREGVVHRDLASRNLLLDDAFHVRISDFGFSRVKRECASRGYTRSDMGPIKWTSPEAMRKRCYSEASDAFSFGVVLYEMFARSPPWEGNENLDVAFRVCSGERMTVSEALEGPPKQAGGCPGSQQAVIFCSCCSCGAFFSSFFRVGVAAQ